MRGALTELSSTGLQGTELDFSAHVEGLDSKDHQENAPRHKKLPDYI